VASVVLLQAVKVGLPQQEENLDFALNSTESFEASVSVPFVNHVNFKVVTSIPGKIKGIFMSDDLSLKSVEEIKESLLSEPGLLVGGGVELVFAIWLLWFVAIITFALCCYTRNIEYSEATFSSSVVEMEHGHFNCLVDSWTCCCTLWCPAVRWADSVSMMGVGGFWTVLLLFSVLVLLNTVTGGLYILGVCTACLMFYCRFFIRTKLDMEITWFTCLSDCLWVLCCPCCSIAQEARAARSCIHVKDHLEKEARWRESGVLQVTIPSTPLTTSRSCAASSADAASLESPPVTSPDEAKLHSAVES